MIKKLDTIHYKKISRITPSQYGTMKKCHYKAILSAAHNKITLLPISPNAYFGIVLHKILELIAKREIRNENDFNERFDSEILIVEEKLKNEGNDFYVPLQKNIYDFGLKKLLLKRHLHKTYHSQRKLENIRYHSEKWYESIDGLIAGKLDLVIDNGNIEIIDFKTGAITEDILDDTEKPNLEIKYEYQNQLKMYAQLYYENTNKFPSKLSIIDLRKQKYSIDFSMGECTTLCEEAKLFLKEINTSIEELKFKSSPSKENCKYCLFRPACSFFLNYIITRSCFNDVYGIIIDVQEFRNGNVSVIIDMNSTLFTINGFPNNMINSFNIRKGNLIGIYNVRRETQINYFTITKNTIIYESE